jgi:hypothetical protein
MIMLGQRDYACNKTTLILVGPDANIVVAQQNPVFTSDACTTGCEPAYSSIRTCLFEHTDLLIRACGPVYLGMRTCLFEPADLLI